MDISTLQQDQFVDLFGPNETNTTSPSQSARFGASDEVNVNLFAPGKEENTTTTEETTLPADSTTTEESTKEPSTTTEESTKDADILGSGDIKKPGRKPKYDFEDASGYFADRIKSGKFVAIEEEGEDGEVKQFIPKTPEEFDEVIDIQVNYQLNQKKKELDEKWYTSKTPAWQAVARYAEMTDDPTEILPFIQGIKNIDSVKDVNEDEIDGAERIVRTRLQQRGDTEDLIDEAIESLKTTDKLVSTAKKYKPMILQEEQRNLQAMIKSKQEEEYEYRTLVNNIKENAIKAIETPIFGKEKLRQEEKAMVYDMIAVPDEQTKGYGIYKMIDDLFEKGDFETLKQVALLLGKKDSFISYVTKNATEKAGTELQKKLRVATESRSSSGNDEDGTDGQRRVVQRNQYTPRFGR